MPAIFKIVVQGEYSRAWGEEFGDLKMEGDTCGNTHLNGALPDQAALLGLLLRLHALNLTLLCVERIESVPPHHGSV